MDEPLSNLDAKLRVQMRSELIQLHRRLGTTTIYVTHDQTEAMTMASRIVVMDRGYVQQIGTPKEIYSAPVNKFVASFIGSPAMNFIEGRIENGSFVAGDLSFKLPSRKAHIAKEYDGKEVFLGIRPEELRLKEYNLEEFEESVEFEMDVTVSELLGHEYILHGTIAGQKVVSKINIDVDKFDDTKQKYQIIVDESKLNIFDKDTEMRLV